MKIRITVTKEGKELYIEDEFIACWPNPETDTLSVIIPYALDAAFRKGQRDKELSIKKVLGLN